MPKFSALTAQCFVMRLMIARAELKLYPVTLIILLYYHSVPGYIMSELMFDVRKVNVNAKDDNYYYVSRDC